MVNDPLLTMVPIPPGTYTFGFDPDDRPMSWPDCGNGLSIDIPAFEIQTNPVTCEMWRSFLLNSRYTWDIGNVEPAVSQNLEYVSFLRRLSMNPDNVVGRFGKMPIVCVNWSDAKEYVKWLSDVHQGRKFAL